VLSDLSRCGLVVAELTRCGVLAQKPAQISFANPSFEIHSSKPLLFFMPGMNELSKEIPSVAESTTASPAHSSWLDSTKHHRGDRFLMIAISALRRLDDCLALGVRWGRGAIYQPGKSAWRTETTPSLVFLVPTC